MNIGINKMNEADSGERWNVSPALLRRAEDSDETEARHPVVKQLDKR
jgi:hypothetical protein